MLVTKIEAVTKTKYKVFLEGEFAFVLYKSELARFRISEGRELEKEQVESLRSEVVLKRAKLRAMHLLTDMDRTEAQLRTKLRQGMYTEEIIDQTLEYVKSFGYIEDKNYAVRFILNRQDHKSKREIYAALCEKGIARDVIEEAMEECCEDTKEREAIRRILEKKRFFAEEADEAKKAKMYSYLMRKGFRYADISQVIQVSEWNT